MILRDESYWTRLLMKYLVEKKREWLCYKIADHFTSGIPDVTIVGARKTVWLELKVLKPGQNVHERVNKDPLQFHDMCKIEDNGNPCWYIIFMPGPDLKFGALTPGFLRHSMSRQHATSFTVYEDFKRVIELVEAPYYE